MTNEEYYISESFFNNFKNTGLSGICAYINFPNSVFICNHSTFSNNQYFHGAVYSICKYVKMTNVCFDKNKGTAGSHYCNSLKYKILSVLANNTHENSDHSFHGTLAAGIDECHFCNNNITKSTATELSTWHYISNNKKSITIFCQMTNIKSGSLCCWNSISTSFNLKKFNFLNCSCTYVNHDYRKDGSKLKYTECVFFLGCSPKAGDTVIYSKCYSDGSVSNANIIQGGYPIEIQFAAVNLCRRAAHNIPKDEQGLGKGKVADIMLSILYIMSK